MNNERGIQPRTKRTWKFKAADELEFVKRGGQICLNAKQRINEWTATLVTKKNSTWNSKETFPCKRSCSNELKKFWNFRENVSNFYDHWGFPGSAKCSVKYLPVFHWQSYRTFRRNFLMKLRRKGEKNGQLRSGNRLLYRERVMNKLLESFQPLGRDFTSLEIRLILIRMLMSYFLRYSLLFRTAQGIRKHKYRVEWKSNFGYYFRIAWLW